MIETSGHGAMRENYCLDDGAYIAVKIVIEAVRRRAAGGGGVGDLLEELEEPLEEREVRMKIKAEDFKAYGGEVLAALEADVTRGDEGGFTDSHPVEVNYEGFRVRKDEGEGEVGLVPPEAVAPRPRVRAQLRVRGAGWRRRHGQGVLRVARVQGLRRARRVRRARDRGG